MKLTLWMADIQLQIIHISTSKTGNNLEETMALSTLYVNIFYCIFWKIKLKDIYFSLPRVIWSLEKLLWMTFSS